jgi:hypothetical protein
MKIMKAFEPSPDFVKNTMEKIHALDGAVSRPLPRLFYLRAALQFGVSAGTLLLGAINMVRLLVTIYAPAVCH